ncbi:murein hydrolase activator EnvC family protein [Agromyces sp. GXS1127]|uniref:murein hydrolase activator EnvC family protein n=1 Tax=Agromyces sp. GXS1127 TaxID=3424181 RepID=UPI003D3100B2
MHSPPPPDRVVTAVAAGLLTALLIALGPAASASPAVPVPADAVPVERWAWPVGPPVVVMAPFRAPPTPYAAGHRGLDLTATAGDVVVSPADGVVSFAGPVAGRGVLSIDHGDGVVSSIEPVAADVATGDSVRAGERVATVGAGGHCDAACVHFGVRVHGEYVSPLLMFGGVPRAVLLPMGR